MVRAHYILQAVTIQTFDMLNQAPLSAHHANHTVCSSGNECIAEPAPNPTTASQVPQAICRCSGASNLKYPVCQGRSQAARIESSEISNNHYAEALVALKEMGTDDTQKKNRFTEN